MGYLKPAIGTSQCTINETIHYVGIGLHSGHKVSMNLHPASPNSGICFVRTDVDRDHSFIRASWRNVVDTRLCTVLGNEHGITISTVEHLLAALRGCGVDNVLIEISSDEVPILDGSSAPLVKMIKQAGVSAQRVPRYGIWIERPIEVRQGERYAILTPSIVPRITVDIDFDNPAIGSQCLSVELLDDVFESEIAPARTFGFAHEVEQLREQGLALGGSMRNAVLVDENGVVNEEGLRFADEFARHKILDCIGDLALADAPIFGHLFTHKPGHRLNNALLRELFSHQDAWSRLSFDEINRRMAREETARDSQLKRAASMSR